VDKLIDALRYRGANAWDGFLDALKEHGHEHVADMLTEALNGRTSQRSNSADCADGRQCIILLQYCIFVKYLLMLVTMTQSE